jgi:DNA-directed RNA polymerase subunit RPC12/RpoP
LVENSEDNRHADADSKGSLNSCPNCGHELSPWQQVLLRVDRALVCKNCWYRIILDISKDDFNSSPANQRD